MLITFPVLNSTMLGNYCQFCFAKVPLVCIFIILGVLAEVFTPPKFPFIPNIRFFWHLYESCYLNIIATTIAMSEVCVLGYQNSRIISEENRVHVNANLLILDYYSITIL